MLSFKSLRHALLMSVASFGGVAATSAIAQSAYAQEATLTYNIEAQDLNGALRQFAMVTGRDVLYAPEVVANKRSPGVHGQMGEHQALQALLAGSGLRFTQTASGGFAVQTNPAQAPDPSQVASTDEDEEIVVTGSRIRGAAPSSSVIVVDQTDISRSGYSNAGEVIRALPQSFGGGQNVNVVGNQAPQNINSISGASTANLRGLGSEATLSLVNGHRLAYDGFTDSVDISLVPLSAIKRVEVLTDGASSLYGSDAIGGVVNFVLVDNFNGLEVRGAAGTTTRGGGTETSYGATAGAASRRANILFSYEHADSDRILGRDRDFTSVEDPTTLQPDTSRDSFFSNGSVELTDRISVYGQGLYTHRTFDDVQSDGGVQFAGPVDVEQWGLVLGSRVNVSDTWQLDLSGTLSRSADDSGTVQSAGGVTLFELTNFYRNSLASFDAQADGVLFAMPGGDARLALGAGHEKREFRNRTDPAFVLPTTAERTSDYGFAQLNLPLVSDANALPGVHELTVDLSARYSNYSDFGSSTDPKVSVLYAPVAGVRGHASWGTAYRAPNLFQAHAPSQSYLYSLPDPLLGGGEATTLLRYAANPDLKPETADFWSAGVSFDPPQSGFHADLTYFSVDYTDRIAIPINDTSSSLTDPANAAFVLRGPSAALVDAIVSSSASFSNFSNVAYDPATVAVIVDDRYQNLASQQASGVDLDLQYDTRFADGDLNLNFNAAYLDLRQRVAPDAPEAKISGTVFNPPDVRARAGAAWTTGPWSVSGFVNYVGPSRDATGAHISSWTTADAQLAFSPNDGASNNTRIALSVQNLFDTDPPRVAAATTSAVPGLNYDSTNASAAGRFVSLAVSKRF